MFKIINTSGADVDMCFYDKSQAGNPRIVKKIRLNGGANVSDPVTRLMFPYKETLVSDEDLEALKTHPVFKRMEGRGFLKIVKERDKAEAKDMTKKDGSAQLVEDDFIVDDEEDIDKIPEEKKKGKKHQVRVVARS